MSDSGNVLIVRGRYLFDAEGGEHRNGATLWIEGERIKGVYGHDAPPDPPNATVLDFPDACILPGLMDSHVHLMYGTEDRMSGPRSYEHVNEIDSDSLMLLRAVRNAYQHTLLAGVTTMRDAGARGRITFDLKEGASAGLFKGFPTVHASGRPITMTGGHFYFCGEEADGEEGCRLAVRRLIKEGADFIKVMGSGGGTYITDYRYPSYTVEELRAIADETHRHGKICTAHCIAAQSIANAVEAGVDSLEHYEFIEADYTRRLDPSVAERIIENKVWLSPTIQTGYRNLESLRKLKDERSLTPAEEENLTYYAWKQEGQLYVTGKLYEMGARRFVMGTDAIARFGDYALGMELMAEAGLPNKEVLLSATRNCAEDFGILDEVGTLAPGKIADVTVVGGDPMTDMSSVGRVLQVIKRGYPLPMDAAELFPHGPGAAVPARKHSRRPPAPSLIRSDEANEEETV